jgi:glycosyltransferase involved in cell wall biosynthesis
MGRDHLPDPSADIPDRLPPLRIALIAPPWFEVPPTAYGGIERICYDLVEGLVDRGHDVTLLAAGRDLTRARFVQALSTPPPGLGTIVAPIQEATYGAAVGRALRCLDIDLVHDHSLVGPLLALHGSTPTVLTAHGPTDGWVGAYYRALGLPLVALSHAQRASATDLNWVGTVPNGIDVGVFRFSETKDDFVLFLGRLSPEKGAHIAAEAANAAGVDLVLAGKCKEEHERRYFDEHVAPRMGPTARWVGEVYGERKSELLARARCVLVPAQWEEPFGLVCIEALASGTPVVGLRRGSLPEIVDTGRTGWLSDDAADLPSLIHRAADIDPHACRAEAIARFDVNAMVDGYEDVYRRVLEMSAAPIGRLGV